MTTLEPTIEQYHTALTLARRKAHFFERDFYIYLRDGELVVWDTFWMSSGFPTGELLLVAHPYTTKDMGDFFNGMARAASTAYDAERASTPTTPYTVKLLDEGKMEVEVVSVRGSKRVAVFAEVVWSSFTNSWYCDRVTIHKVVWSSFTNSWYCDRVTIHKPVRGQLHPLPCEHLLGKPCEAVSWQALTDDADLNVKRGLDELVSFMRDTARTVLEGTLS